LRSHFAQVHCTPGTKPFLCEHPGCDRSFAQKVHLKAHIKTHDRMLSTFCSSYPLPKLTPVTLKMRFCSLSIRLSSSRLRFTPTRFTSIPRLVQPSKAHESCSPPEMSLSNLSRKDVHDSKRTQESFTDSRERRSEGE